MSIGFSNATACIVCGRGLEAPRTVVCGPVCRRRRLVTSEAFRRAKGRSNRLHPSHHKGAPASIWTAGYCRVCGDAFVVMRHGGSVCAKVTCRGGVRRRSHESHRTPSHKLRVAVVERDGMVCYLCGQVIDADLPPQHKLAFTLDHVQPRSAAGPDTIDNLRPAHRRCNSEKGDDLPGFWERVA